MREGEKAEDGAKGRGQGMSSETTVKAGLPEAFLDRMQQMLGGEYPDFLRSYQEEEIHALRVNSLKCRITEVVGKAPFSLTPVPWCSEGYYYEAKERPGLHPWHDAGVYYIQEASAMAPAEYLGALPGERILDLCGAPGGKSTQIAAAMKQQGVLICNEIHPARAKILSENVERMGICNGIVTNESPQRLAERWPEYFDRILVDAPCSGEGMFRKNADARKEWSAQQVSLCAGRQDEILECAVRMLKPGGRLVYSTCTFAPEEDEGTVFRLLEKYPELRTTAVPAGSGMTAGEPRWACPEGTAEEPHGLSDTIRLWPHKLKGEGHFVAILEKSGDGPWAANPRDAKEKGRKKGLPDAEIESYLKFRKEYLPDVELNGTYVLFGDQLYLVPGEAPRLEGLKVLRPGLHLGTRKKNRFEPSHALALALRPEQVRDVRELSSASMELAAYLRGETLPGQGEKGWYLITADGFSIGWGKQSGSVLKNHYPKGLRKP